MLYSEEVENAVIGCVIMNPENVMFMCHNSRVTEDCFYVPMNRVAFSAALSMEQEGRPIDLLTLTERCVRTHDDKMAITKHLELCVESGFTTAHAEHYIEKLVEFAKRRDAHDVAEHLKHKMETGGGADDEISNAVSDLLQISAEASNVSKDDIISESALEWEKSRTGGVAGLASPWPKFNQRFGGLRNGAVALFAGKAGMGKSSAMATWLQYLGIMNIPVAAIPFEDGAKRTYQRIAGIHGDFSTFNLDVGNSTRESIETASQALRAVMKFPLYMEDKPMTIERISSWATRMKAKHKIKALFIDAFKDIQRRDMDVKGDDQISMALCSLAKRLDIPILVFVHVRKQNGQDSIKQERLMPDDIRGSGRIYSDCRQLIVLQGFFDKPTGRMQYEFELAKNNYGPTGVFPMIRISNRCKWEEAPDITTDSNGQTVK